MVHGLETMKRLNDNEVKKQKIGKKKNLHKLPRGDAVSVRRLLNRPWTQQELEGRRGKRSRFSGKDVL